MLKQPSIYYISVKYRCTPIQEGGSLQRPGLKPSACVRGAIKCHSRTIANTDTVEEEEKLRYNLIPSIDI